LIFDLTSSKTRSQDSDSQDQPTNHESGFDRGLFTLSACVRACSRVILLGDLNYRISLPEAKTRLLVERRDWKTLLENDQLRAEVTRGGGAFRGWSEGDIAFSPTYKYYPNSDTYYGGRAAAGGRGGR